MSGCKKRTRHRLECGGIRVFDRLVAARENGRRMLRKEAEHYARRQDHDLDETTEE